MNRLLGIKRAFVVFCRRSEGRRRIAAPTTTIREIDPTSFRQPWNDCASGHPITRKSTLHARLLPFPPEHTSLKQKKAPFFQIWFHHVQAWIDVSSDESDIFSLYGLNLNLSLSDFDTDSERAKLLKTFWLNFAFWGFFRSAVQRFRWQGFDERFQPHYWQQ